MARFASLLYGGAAYGVFFLTFLYAVGFVSNLGVPKGIDDGRAAPLAHALIVDTLLLGLFAIQHSVMARPAFKRIWTKIVPSQIERSTFVLFASLALILLFWQWRPMPAPIWTVESPIAAGLLQAASLAGWGLVLVSTFLISHFELFGLKQVALHWLRRPTGEPEFRTPSLYRVVRHPIYLGFLMALLGGAGDERGPSPVRPCDDRLHPGRDSARGARPSSPCSALSTRPTGGVWRCSSPASGRAPSVATRR